MPLTALTGLSAKDYAQILSQAVAQMQIGRNENALSILEVMVALDPDNAVYQEYLGLCLQRLGRHQDAVVAYGANIEALTKLTSVGPRLCEAHLLRGQLYAGLGAQAEAQADLAAAKTNDQGRDPELSGEIRRLEQVLAVAGEA